MAKSKKAAARKARRPARRASPRKASARRDLRPIPAGFHSVTASLVLRDAGKAMDFWKAAFGAVEIMRMPAPGGQGVWHGEVRVGDTIVMCNYQMPVPGWTRAPTPERAPSCSLWIYADGADALFDRAVKAGARVLSPMADMFWGDRVGVLADPFDVVWAIA